MSACPIYDGVAGGPCGWCRQPPDAHRYRWCAACRGDRSVPDLTDRIAQREGAPLWAWRQHPCGCRLDDGHVVRRGGVVTPDGRPVDDPELNAAGIN